MATSAGKLNKDLKAGMAAEVMVIVDEKLSISEFKECAKAEDVKSAWKDSGDNLEWFVIEEQILDFPSHIKAYVRKGFEGRVDTGDAEMDALITAAIKDAVSHKTAVVLG